MIRITSTIFKHFLVYATLIKIPHNTFSLMLKETGETISLYESRRKGVAILGKQNNCNNIQQRVL